MPSRDETGDPCVWYEPGYAPDCLGANASPDAERADFGYEEGDIPGRGALISILDWRGGTKKVPGWGPGKRGGGVPPGVGMLKESGE
jgi:hypothetical protein